MLGKKRKEKKKKGKKPGTKSSIAIYFIFPSGWGRQGKKNVLGKRERGKKRKGWRRDLRVSYLYFGMKVLKERGHEGKKKKEKNGGVRRRLCPLPLSTNSQRRKWGRGRKEGEGRKKEKKEKKRRKRFITERTSPSHFNACKRGGRGKRSGGKLGKKEEKQYAAKSKTTYLLFQCCWNSGRKKKEKIFGKGKTRRTKEKDKPT